MKKIKRKDIKRKQGEYSGKFCGSISIKNRDISGRYFK